MKIIAAVLFIVCNLIAGERVVTLTPSINEIVYALGVGKNVVANTRHCDFPEESKRIPKIGGYATISLEKILQANPTVVIGQDYDQKLQTNLKALGIKTLMYKTNSLNTIKNTINELGVFFHKENQAQKIVGEINTAIESLKGIVNNQKILVVISPRKTLSSQIYVAGNYIYFDDIIQSSGNENAFSSKSKAQPIVNTEKIIRMNPDIIVLLTPFLDGKIDEQEELKAIWRRLPIKAAQQNNIYTVHKLYAGIPSQRVVYFIQDFKKILEDVRNK